MKSFSKLSILFFTIITLFSACKEEPYADWKVLNDNKYNEEYAKTTYTKTSSGLCYKILYPGALKQANVNSYVVVEYTGTLINGVVFDSGTYAGYLSNTVAGWQEAIVKLRIGGEMDMFFPYSLGYGSTASGDIPAYSMLKFKVKLIDAQY